MSLSEKSYVKLSDFLKNHPLELDLVEESEGVTEFKLSRIIGEFRYNLVIYLWRDPREVNICLYKYTKRPEISIYGTSWDMHTFLDWDCKTLAKSMKIFNTEIVTKFRKDYNPSAYKVEFNIYNR